MTVHEVEAIVGGFHGDPFRILGPHVTDLSDDQAAWEIRAFLPQAITVEVLLQDGTGPAVPMKKKHAYGFFVATLPGEPADYRLRVTRWDGREEVLDDAYRYPPLLTSFELHLHGEGTHYETYRSLGAHLAVNEGQPGVRFAVWAPNAQMVSVCGEFNEWDTRRHGMRRRDGGIWEIFVPGVTEGAIYKYNVRSRDGGQQLKADPYAFYAEVPPHTASVVYDLSRFAWNDQEWMDARGAGEALKRPMSVYEVHLGSWLRDPQGQPLTYRELASSLVEYVRRMGFTHIELLPIMEHPFSGSWGYQVTGFYAPTSRFGSPSDFMYLVDCCHQAGIGVIVDWVPGHFPKDAHGLARFDGTALYEHEDPRQGEHRDWGTLIFNYGRNEIRSFLISNALFWMKLYHIDGLRVDAVASMLYLDYSRKADEWIPNQYGGHENLEAIDFLKRFNEVAHTVPGAVTIAEESTAFPGVSRPVYSNGLGFTMKWNMGWMHDMLAYFSRPPLFRRYHQSDITFSLLYAFTENFVLPISHDEVVHGKGSLLRKMPGDEWQRFANCRAFLAYMWAHPGKKLLFMGCEIGQYEEWNSEGSVRWDLLDYDYHRQLQALVQELNRLYRAHPALYENDFHHSGFEWVDFRDMEHSVIAFLRRGMAGGEVLFFVCNFTPEPLWGYRLGVPLSGMYQEILNTDSESFGGSNVGNGGGVVAEAVASHGQPFSLALTLPPLAVVGFRHPGPPPVEPVLQES